ncbi:MAG: hypothetical protein OHK0036_15710 [Bacteroidia bacterium]
MKEVVEIKSKGRYQLKYDSIRLDFLRGKLYVENVKVIPDFSKIPLNKDKIHIEVPIMEINTSSLWKAYFKKEIKLYDIQVRNPFIEIYQKIDNQQNDSIDDFKIDNLYYLIDSYANLLEINRFMVYNGKFVIKHPQNKHTPLTLQHIFLEIKNFRVNHETNHPKRPFDTDDIKLHLAKNTIPISHGDYTLYIGDAKLETGIQHILLKDISLFPKDNALKNKNTIQLILPSINLLGVDFKEAYLHKNLNIREILLSNSFIRLEQIFSTDIKKDTPIIEPYQVISKYLHQIFIQKIHLDNAEIDFNFNKNTNIKHKGIYLSLHHFLLDSISQHQRKDKFFINDFDIKIPEFEYYLKNYHLFSKDLSISTKDSFISFNHFTMKDEDKNIKLKAKNIDFNNVSIWNLLQNKELILSKINIEKPEIELEINFNHTNRQTINQNLSLRDKLKYIFFKISPTFKKIKIDNIKINNANCKISDKNTNAFIIFDSLNLLINKINLPTYHPEKQLFFISKNMKIDIKKLSGNALDTLHKFLVQDLSFDSKEGILFTKKIYLEPIDSLSKFLHKNLFSYKTKNLYIDGINLNRILLDSVLHLNNIYIYQPEFKLIKKDTEEITNLGVKSNKGNSIFNFKEIKIDNFLIDKGKLDIENNNKDFKVGNIEAKNIDFCLKEVKFDSLEWLKKNISVKFDDFTFSTGEFDYYLSDSIHKISLEHLNFDSKIKRLNFYNISINPKKHISENHSFYIEGFFPNVSINGLDLINLQQKEVYLDSINVQQDYSRLIINPKLNNYQIKENSRTDLKSFLEKIVSNSPLKFIKIDKTNILLKDNDLLTVSENPFHTNCKIIELKINNFYLDSITAISANNYYFSENVEILLDNLEYKLPTKNHLFSIKKLFLSLKNDSLNVENITFQPLLRKMESPSEIPFIDKNIISLNIRNINIDKIGLYDLLFENKINTNKIFIKNPIITLISPHIKLKNDVSKLSNSFHTDSISKIFREFFSNLKINNFTIENATIHTNKYLPDNRKFSIFPNFSKQKLDISHINLNIQEFDTKDSINLLNSKDISLNIKDLKIPLADSLNWVVAKKLGISTSQKLIFADSLELIPRYSKKDFAWKSGEGADRISMNSERVSFLNVDFKQLLDNQRFVSKKLILNNFDIDIFGNRTVPVSKAYKTKYLLPSMLKKIPVYLKIDSIFWNNGHIYYEEFAGEMDYKKSSDSTHNIIQNSGFISLNNLQSILMGITNDSALIAKGTKVQLNAQFQLMENGGKAFVEIEIPLNDIEENHTVKGVVTEMPLQKINPLLEKLAFIKVKNGFLKGLDFQFNANHHYAKGWMKFRYDNLKISILNSKKLKGSEYKEDKFLSFFANNLFIRPENPRMLFLKKGEIYHERDVQKSMINYWVRSVLSGVISSITPKKQKPSDLMKDEVDEDEKIIKIENKKMKKERKMKKNQIEIEN